MLDFTNKKIFLACGATDLRKSIDGLSIIVQTSFELDLFQNAIFVFCNRNHNRIKILEWENGGFWLYLKRLEKGRFKWPDKDDEEKTMSLNFDELKNLLNSPSLEQKIKRKEVVVKNII